MDIKESVLLAKYTTFRIGGPAKYFFVAKNKENLIKAVKTAQKNDLPFFILGGGSNVLFPDKGFNGLVIKTQNSKLKAQNHSSKVKTIYVEAGTGLEKLVKLTAEESLTGAEWMAGIPGTVGGAIYGNAQAFGNTIADLAKSVEALDSEALRFKSFSKKECQFSVKNSIFKRNKKLIIVSAVLELKKGDKKEIQRKIKENLDYRKENHPLNFPSAGSVFVNKEGFKIKNKKLLEEFPRLKKFNKKELIPSAYLIEQCGLKGKEIGGAQISEKHANFIVNLGEARADDVLKLIKLAKQEVKNEFGINLKEEIQIIHH